MELRKINKVLIANRSEIARRIIRTLHTMQIHSVAVYDEREKGLQYVWDANEAYSLGTGSLSDTFLNIDKIIDIAQFAGCDAIHPGYGFLSENSNFAERCEAEGLIFIGPSARSIALMGDKQQAIREAKQAGIPVIPGCYGTPKEISNQLDASYLPCLVKPALGGGGKAMRVVSSLDNLHDELQRTSAEAQKYFGNEQVFVEKKLEGCRHIEVQVLADKHGNAIHVYERECSLQRRYQKIIEEAPAASLDESLRQKLYADALRLVNAIGYYNVGTVEFLVDVNNQHYFLEMNTRIQVEHPVTEMVTGIDLVKEQVLIAEGKVLSDYLYAVSPSGHAIEARVYAEDPLRNFQPAVGDVQGVHFSDACSRLECDVKNGDTLHTSFDPMIAKVCAWGEDRSKAINKMKQVLADSAIHGVKNNRSFLYRILSHAKFLENRISTAYLDENLKNLLPPRVVDRKELSAFSCIGLYLYLQNQNDKLPEAIRTIGHWRMNKQVRLWMNTVPFIVCINYSDRTNLQVSIEGHSYQLEHLSAKGNKQFFKLNEEYHTVCFSRPSVGRVEMSIGRDDMIFDVWKPKGNAEQQVENEGQAAFQDTLNAPLSGTLLKVLVEPGQRVRKGDRMLVIESMKMENELRLPFDAIIKDVLHVEGSLIHEDAPLVKLLPFE